MEVKANMQSFRYENVFAQVSFQFCGHLDTYLIENTRRLGLVYFQTRNGSGEHVFRLYECGVLKEEVKFSFRRSVVGYYLDWWRFWNRQLNRFRRGQREVQTIFTHPLGAFGKCLRRNARTCFWQWDHFPDGAIVSRIFNAVARYYAPRCTNYCPVSGPIGQAVGMPDVKPVMLGIIPPCRFGDAASSRLLVVGQLRRGQGIEAVLDFIASHEDYSLSLLGAPAGDFGDEIRRRIAAADMSDRVFYPGRFVDDAELSSEAARCFAALALYDTAKNNLTHYADPGKVKSSIEMGLPVVMTRISSIVPYLERFKAGEVIDSLDELPTAIDKIRSQPEVYFEGCRAFGEYFNYERYYANRLPLWSGIGDATTCGPSENLVDYGHAHESDNSSNDKRNDAGGVHSFSARREQVCSDLRGIRMLASEVSAELLRTVQHGERASVRDVRAALVTAAKKLGCYIPYSDRAKFGDVKRRRSGESEIFMGTEYGVLVKFKDPEAKQSLKRTTPEDWLYEHVIHNVLFPGTRYEFLGVSEAMGAIRMVLRQKNVNALSRPTDMRIAVELKSLGLSEEGRYAFGNEVLAVTDVSEKSDNVLLDDDDKVYFIDPLIVLKRPAREVLQWLVGQSQ